MTKKYYIIEGKFLETLKNYFHTRGMEHTEQLLNDILMDVDVSVLKEEAEMFRYIENISFPYEVAGEYYWLVNDLPDMIGKPTDFRSYLKFIMEKRNTETIH